jgi:nitroreductase
MTTRELDQDTVMTAIEAAGLAPSLHNTQPWRFRLSERQVDLYADRSRWLPATDGDERDLVLSCGAALHHLRVALAAQGIPASVSRLPDPQQRDLLARVQLDVDHPVTDPGADLFPFIAARRTDRRPFRNWPVPDAFVQALVERAAEQGGLLREIRDAHARDAVMRAIREAATVQQDVPGYRAELAEWTGRIGSDGVPPANLLQSAAGAVTAAREFPAGDITTPESTRPETVMLMVLGTTSRDRLSQLRAGEALSAVLLQATEHGLATCPLSQPLEIGDTRRLLDDEVLGGTLSAQIVLRVGWAPAVPPLPPTPRRSVSDTIELAVD